jgi:hypothetical protein
VFTRVHHIYTDITSTYNDHIYKHTNPACSPQKVASSCYQECLGKLSCMCVLLLTDLCWLTLHSSIIIGHKLHSVTKLQSAMTSLDMTHGVLFCAHLLSWNQLLSTCVGQVHYNDLLSVARILRWTNHNQQQQHLSTYLSYRFFPPSHCCHGHCTSRITL